MFHTYKHDSGYMFRAANMCHVVSECRDVPHDIELPKRVLRCNEPSRGRRGIPAPPHWAAVAVCVNIVQLATRDVL